MGSQLATLTSSDIQRFELDGYVVVRQAFSPADALAMERRWWSELEDTHGIRAGDRSSWRQIVGDLKAAPGGHEQCPRTGRTLGVSGRVRPRTAIPLTLISLTNTALAITAYLAARRDEK